MGEDKTMSELIFNYCRDTPCLPILREMHPESELLSHCKGGPNCDMECPHPEEKLSAEKRGSLEGN
jgi:hypothetical protein